MATKKKKRPAKKSWKKNLPEVVIVRHTVIPVDDTLYPEKMKKAKEILSRTKFMD